MIVDLDQARWKKKLLDSRTEGVIYQMLGMDDKGVIDFFFVYRDGQWQFKVNMSKPPVCFSGIDEATQFILEHGVEEYDKKYGV